MPNPYFDVDEKGFWKHPPDTPRVRRSAIVFGNTSITRVSTVPPTDYGNLGDVVLIDGSLYHNNHNPCHSVGIWIKVPSYYISAPKGNIVVGRPGGVCQTDTYVRINGKNLVLPKNSLEKARDQINQANIPNVKSYLMGEALVIEGDNSDLDVISNDPDETNLETLGLYSQKNEYQEGIWVPVQLGVESNNPGHGPGRTDTSFNPAVFNEYNKDYLFFGMEEEDDWRIRRIDRITFLSSNANSLNNIGIDTLEEAWPQKETLVYGG